MQIGYKLAPGAFGPNELVRQAVAAEEAGFDFVLRTFRRHRMIPGKSYAKK